MIHEWLCANAARQMECLALAPKFDTVVIFQRPGISKPIAGFFCRALERLDAIPLILFFGVDPPLDVAGGERRVCGRSGAETHVCPERFMCRWAHRRNWADLLRIVRTGNEAPGRRKHEPLQQASGMAQFA